MGGVDAKGDERDLRCLTFPSASIPGDRQTTNGRHDAPNSGVSARSTMLRALLAPALAALANPYFLPTLLALLLAYFVLHRAPVPAPDAKPRPTAAHIRRLGPSRFLFPAPSGDAHLLDLSSHTLSALPEAASDPEGESTPLENVRLLESGPHFHSGRAVAIEAPEPRTLLFPSRLARETFESLVRLESSRDRPSTLALFLTTFNVGNSQPPDSLSPWLGRALEADVVAIGAQECSYAVSEEAEEGEVTAVGVGAAAAAGVGSAKEHWHSLLQRHFPEAEFECVAMISAWDRCLTLFVKRKLLSVVSRVRQDTANVGLGGVAGNKGAIGVRFSVYETDFVVVNSHLAAHHKEVNRRNEDFASIAGGLRGLRDHPEVDVLSSAVHHTFWMGDLNYRINLERDKVLQLVAEKNWTLLQEADQLLQEMAAGRAFQGFSEGKTDFAPTYRYEHGSRNYSAVKLRVPSYCDRILFRSLPGCKVDLLDYRPCDDITTSDHSPVAAVFSASLVHATRCSDVETIAAGAGVEDVDEGGLIGPIISPRSLSMRALIPTGIPGFSSSSGAQLVFKKLSAVDIPEMDHGGRRVAVAKVLHIHNHVGWKKHDELGEGRHADPYCTFHGDAVAELDEGEYRTRTVIASQNPVWEADRVPAVDLISSEFAMLKGKCVVMTVKDEIISRRDDTIGSAVLMLGEGEEMGTSESPVGFDLPIMLGGRQQGRIRGEYLLRKV